MSNRLRKCKNQPCNKFNIIEFMEGIMGVALIINPKCDIKQLSNIDFTCKQHSELETVHDKNMICELATIIEWNEEWDYWICAAKFEGNNSFYDISPNIIMRNEWYRNGILSLTKTNAVQNEYLQHWMTTMCEKVNKYKRKAHKMKRTSLLVNPRFMVDVRLLITQYGLFLGFNMWGTLNANAQRSQQKKYVKLPILIYNKWNEINEFISTPNLCYTKNNVIIYNVDQISIFFKWLGMQYVLRTNEFGLCSPIQTQLSYNKKTQVIMVKYDVALKDNEGNVHYIYRDLNAENPNGPFACLRLNQKQTELLVFGYIKQYASAFAVCLIKICLSFTLNLNA
eukprot:518246_1